MGPVVQKGLSVRRFRVRARVTHQVRQLLYTIPVAPHLKLRTLLGIFFALSPLCGAAQEIRLWDFSGGAAAWTPNDAISDFNQTPEGLDFDCIAEDPYLTGPLETYPLSRLLRFTVRMKSMADSQGEVFYGEDFVAERSRRFTVIPDGEWREYEVYLPNLAPRARLRLDPSHGPGHVTVAWIRIENVPNPTLDNGVLELRLDLSAGGSITYLAQSGSRRNLVNIFDRGRYIQQSYYAGQAIDRRAEGQAPNWSPWSWNPIQVGDTYGNVGLVLEAWVRDGTAYTRCQPLLWDMNREFAQCFIEIWASLEGNQVHIRNKLTCFRTDDRWNLTENHQELPAVYSIGDLFNLYTYVGAAPWTSADLTKISNVGPPWEYWNTSEHWVALVDPNSFGIGVYNGNAVLFAGGFHGSFGGGASDNSSGYMTPLRTERLGKTSIYEYEYDLIVGTLNDIRHAVYLKKGIEFEGGPTSTPIPTRTATPTVTPTSTATPTPTLEWPPSGVRLR